MTSERTEQMGCPWPQRSCGCPAGCMTLDNPFPNPPEPQFPHLWSQAESSPSSRDHVRDQTPNAGGPPGPCALREGVSRFTTAHSLIPLITGG